MSSDSRTGLKSRFRTTVSGIQEPIPRPATVALKFFICGTFGQLAWLLFVSELSPSGSEVDAGSVSNLPLEVLLLLGILTLPSLVAAGIYLRLPTETVDVYHWFGKSSAMFFGLNISLSGPLVLHEMHFGGLVRENSAALEAIGTWVLASFFLPGLCLGCFVASRWAR